MKNYRLFMGAGIWVLIAALVLLSVNLYATPKLETGESLDQLIDYSFQPQQQVQLESEIPQGLAIADPIFYLDEDGKYHRIGEIKSVGSEKKRSEQTTKCSALFYGNSPLIASDCTVTFHRTPASLEWIIGEMSKDGKWEDYKSDLVAAFRIHGQEIIDEFRPLIEEGLREASVVVAKDLKRAYEKRQPRIVKIAKRYEKELVSEEILPLIKEEILPIIRKHAEPKINEVGQEIWQRTSLWRFSWRIAYDKMPLPKKDLAKKEWERFVDEEVLPVFESHLKDFVQIQKEILSDVTKSAEVEKVFKESFAKIAKDKEIRQIIEEILVAVFVKNQRLNKLVSEFWKNRETRTALGNAADRFEGTLVRITRKMFGTPETSITPSFARVLRNQVLRKDRCWWVVTMPVHRDKSLTPVSDMKFKRGVTGTENPFLFEDESRGKEL